VDAGSDVTTNAPGALEHPAAHHQRTTRKPLPFWDRIRIVLLCGVLFGLFVWHDVSSNPILPLNDAFRRQLDARWWLLAVAALELVRQAHYLLSEIWSRWHLFWATTVFGGINRRTGRMNDWTRYRLGRVLRIVIGLVILDLVLASLFDLTPATALVEAPSRLVSFLPLAAQLLFGFFFVIVQFVGLFWFLSRGGVDVYMPDDIDTRFTDVWGQDNVLERVKENIVFLEDPESIESKGGFVPSGLLLWGPPGTGKTLMAEAVAGETGKPYVFVDPGAFTAMFMGVGIMKVKSLFRKLRKLALRYGGVIVFFDEADSLGNRGQLAPGGLGGGGSMSPAVFADRPSCNGLGYLTPESQHAILRDGFVMGGMGGGGGGMGTLQALLSELSGLKKPRGFVNRHLRRVLGMRPKPPPKYRILVMMATNMPQALDEALLRPGRIDRIYKVGYPSKAGRIRTYQGYLAKVAHMLTPEQVDKLATITPYATGATIKDLVNESLITAIRDGRDVIEWRDVIKAKQLKDLGPPEDVEYIERERHAVAVHEACHAVIAYRARRHLTIDIATIEKGGNYLGMVASIPPEDQFTRWRTEYEADIMVSLASLAGERMFFDGDNSSGVSGDLESATFLATYMEGYWGMGATVTSHGVTHRVGVGGGGKPGAPDPKEGGERDMLAGSLGRRIETKLGELLERTEAMLAENRRHVLAVAHALETNKTVTGDDVEAIIEGTRGPLLDGRMYHEPEFLELAERYHRDAVVAHNAHDKPALALPKPSVWWHVEEEDEPPYANGHAPVVATAAADVAPYVTDEDD
jgi:ATP-dependent Zn protease